MIQLETNPSRHPFPARRAALAVVLLLGLGSVPVLAQEPAPNQAEFSELGHQAFEKFNQDNIAGAIALLEEQRATGGATHVDLALLGTLYLETGRAADALEALRPQADSATADAAVLYNAGRAALASGQTAAAEGYLERSVARLPVSPATRELGLLRGGQGRTAEAYRLLRAWVAQNLSDLEARTALIAAGLSINRAAEVGPLLQGLPPADPKIMLLRSQFLAQTGDVPGAITTLELLRDNHSPEMRTDVYRLLAGNYIEAGRPRDAVELLEGQIGGDPRLALVLAEGQRRNGAAAAALATLEPFASSFLEAVERRGPLAFEVAFDYGHLLLSARRTAEAVPHLEKAASLRPADKQAWKSLGDALTDLGRQDEAKNALEKFRQLDEREIDQRRLVETAAQDPGAKALVEAQKAINKGEIPRALAVLRQEIALSPRDLRPRLLEMRVLALHERLPDALAAAETAVELFPEHADAIYQRGVIHLGLDSREAAEQDFRRALEMDQNHVAALNDLAVVMMVQGNKDEARQLLERLLELSPDNQLARENLQRLVGGG